MATRLKKNNDASIILVTAICIISIMFILNMLLINSADATSDATLNEEAIITGLLDASPVTGIGNAIINAGGIDTGDSTVQDNLWDYLTIDIPLFDTLGNVGLALRAILLIMVLIGLIDLLWIG